MKRRGLLHTILILILIILSLITVVVLIKPKQKPVQTVSPDISSFEECVKAGYKIMKSNPAQCSIPEGTTFTEVINTGMSEEKTIIVKQPGLNDIVTNPIIIKGEAKGNWFFEGSFPIRIEDLDGKVVGRGQAEAETDWMSESFVPFIAEVAYTPPESETGTIILEKDNPSGLPQNADEFRIPIIFEKINNNVTKAIKIFFYNVQKDIDKSCSPDYVLPVSRQTSISKTPIQDTIKLLLKGDIKNDEKNSGFTTEFPLSGVELIGANLKSGALTLEFRDPQNKTTGGSCRVTLLRSQIEKTAKQFPEVRDVRIIPENLFQP